MQVYIKVCEHCGRRYSYYLTGGNNGSSEQYCPECQGAIDDALKKISKKFEQRLKEINEPRLFKIFDKIKEEQERKDSESNNLGFPCLIVYSNHRDNIETYIHNGQKFVVEWDDDTPEDKHVYIEMEYDLEKDCFTDYVTRHENTDSYSFHRTFKPKKIPFISDYMESKNLDGPSGKLFYMDFKYTNEDYDIDDVKKEHKKISSKMTVTSFILNTLLIEGRFDVKYELKCELDVNNLCPYLDYEITTEQYEDEDVAYITNIDCK